MGKSSVTFHGQPPCAQRAHNRPMVEQLFISLMQNLHFHILCIFFFILTGNISREGIIPSSISTLFYILFHVYLVHEFWSVQKEVMRMHNSGK